MCKQRTCLVLYEAMYEKWVSLNPGVCLTPLCQLSKRKWSRSCQSLRIRFPDVHNNPVNICIHGKGKSDSSVITRACHSCFPDISRTPRVREGKSFLRADSCSEPSYVISVHTALLRACCGWPLSSHLPHAYCHKWERPRLHNEYCHVWLEGADRRLPPAPQKHLQWRITGMCERKLALLHLGHALILLESRSSPSLRTYRGVFNALTWTVICWLSSAHQVRLLALACEPACGGWGSMQIRWSHLRSWEGGNPGAGRSWHAGRRWMHLPAEQLFASQPALLVPTCSRLPEVNKSEGCGLLQEAHFRIKLLHLVIFGEMLCPGMGIREGC